MMIKGILISVILLLNTIVFSQGKNNSDVIYNLKDTLRIDTVEIKVKKVLFITADTVFNGFISIDTLGIFHVFGSQERLDNYIQLKSGVYYFYDDKIFGTGNYVWNFNFVEQVDTIISYRNVKVDYYDETKLRTDNLGKPILEYDIEHSYILQQINDSLTFNQYVYFLINEGTKILPTLPLNHQKNSVLYKININQDTSFNFFIYELCSHSFDGIKLVKKDSIILSFKKLRKKWGVLSNFEKLLKIKNESDIFSQNFEKTYVIITERKRFIVSAYTDPKKDDLWAVLVESISLSLERFKRKFFE